MKTNNLDVPTFYFLDCSSVSEPQVIGLNIFIKTKCHPRTWFHTKAVVCFICLQTRSCVFSSSTTDTSQRIFVGPLHSSQPSAVVIWKGNRVLKNIRI